MATAFALYRAAADELGAGPKNGAGSANADFAKLTRQSWADYLKNIVPYENKLIEYATDPTVVSNAMTKAGEQVVGSFDRQAADSSERLRGLGLTLNADEQRASTRSLGLAKSVAEVQAINSTRDQVTARQRSILGLPAPNIGSMPA